jgi:hypothetical protein
VTVAATTVVVAAAAARVVAVLVVAVLVAASAVAAGASWTREAGGFMALSWRKTGRIAGQAACEPAVAPSTSSP